MFFYVTTSVFHKDKCGVILNFFYALMVKLKKKIVALIPIEA